MENFAIKTLNKELIDLNEYKLEKEIELSIKIGVVRQFLREEISGVTKAINEVEAALVKLSEGKKYKIEQLKKAGEFLEEKGINLTNYTIFDTSGDFLTQIPIALWLTEFAERAVAKNNPSKLDSKALVLHNIMPRFSVVHCQFFGVEDGVIENNLTEKEANKLIERLNKERDCYEWYEIKPTNPNGA